MLGLELLHKPQTVEIRLRPAMPKLRHRGLGFSCALLLRLLRLLLHQLLQSVVLAAQQLALARRQALLLRQQRRRLLVVRQLHSALQRSHVVGAARGSGRGGHGSPLSPEAERIRTAR